MYDNIRLAFEILIKIPKFQILVKEYRFRFGIPENGFTDLSSEQYKIWIRTALRGSDYQKDQFLFIAKRCRNLIPDRDPVPNTLLAYYFLFNRYPESSIQNEYLFSIDPSGILGSFNITFIVPLLFNFEALLNEIDKHKGEIQKVSENVQLTKSILDMSNNQAALSLNPQQDFLATTPGNGADLVDKVHRDVAYLAEFGRVVLREHLQNMKDEDFVIRKYEDKNKPIYSPIQQMGMFLLNRGLYAIVEEYWTHIDQEIKEFNTRTGKRVNRGITLANTGVAQIAQGKTIEGLFNIYRGYADDRECLLHLPNVNIDPERDMANSRLFTQFEGRLVSRLFQFVISKFQSVFHTKLAEKDLSNFILTLSSDKKLLLYMTLYRYSFAASLNNELTNVISRSEVIRSLAELALWFEDELKRKNVSLTGKTLIKILDQKVGQLNPTRGQYTNSTNLSELNTKISNALNANDSLLLTNARIMGCLRNFAGHNLDVKDHVFFKTSDEVFARMLSFIIYSKTQGWI